MNDNNISNSSNQTAILDLIQNIQTKLDNEQTNKNVSTNDELKEQNEEKINHVEDSEDVQKVGNETSNDSSQNSSFDLSSLLGNIDLSSILSSFSGNKNTNEESAFNFQDIDPNTISKMQKIMSSFNGNEPKRVLLKSLKPFLRKSRQDKLGEYMTILSLVDAVGIFDKKGSD